MESDRRLYCLSSRIEVPGLDLGSSKWNRSRWKRRSWISFLNLSALLWTDDKLDINALCVLLRSRRFLWRRGLPEGPRSGGMTM